MATALRAMSEATVATGVDAWRSLPAIAESDRLPTRAGNLRVIHADGGGHDREASEGEHRAINADRYTPMLAGSASRG